MNQQLILGRYRPLEDLGQGSFGSVLLAWDTRMQRRVAIKRLPLPEGRPGKPAYVLDAEGGGVLGGDSTGLGHPGLAEARTGAMLNHPNIVTIFDFDIEDDEALLVMEHIDGAPLSDVLDAVDGPLTADEAATVLSDVFSAVIFAHDNGVLHLDIKPDNILITAHGRAKVADFGMAGLSVLGGHKAAWGGTPGYMPLEQLRAEPVSEATDQWALGALAFEVLTGNNPFACTAAATANASARSLVAFEPPLPSHENPDLPRPLDDVLLTATEHNPSARFDSAEDLAEELLAFLGDAATGRALLAELMATIISDDEPAERPTLVRVGLWDRLQGRAGRILLGLGASAVNAWLAWAGLSHFGLEPRALLAAAALIALPAAFVPALGAALGVGCLVIGLVATGSWAMALIVALACAVWWWRLARRSVGEAVLPLVTPLLALARVPFLQPLVAGFALPPAHAALSALAGAALFAAVAVDAQPSAAAAALLGWPAAAALMSFACKRATRGAAALGAALACVLIGGVHHLASVAASAVTGVFPTWTAPWVEAALGTGAEISFAIMLGCSLIIMAVIILLGAPPRSADEGLRPVRGPVLAAEGTKGEAEEARGGAEEARNRAKAR